MGGEISLPCVRYLGLESAKEALQEAIILPSRFPSLFTGGQKPQQRGKQNALLFNASGVRSTLLFIFRRKKTLARHSSLWSQSPLHLVEYLLGIEM